MTKKSKDQQTHTRALLVNVKIHFWEARKHDRTVTEATNAEHGADSDAGRYHKRLLGGKVPEMSAMLHAYGRLRETHRAQTLPWSDEGWRILPTDNYFHYTEAVREHVAAFDEAVDEFVAAYPRLRDEARNRLGDMYNDEDYPSPNDVRHRYKVEIEYAPIPLGQDLRVDLPSEELAAAAAEVEARVKRTVDTAMRDAWSRLSEAVERLRDRLDGDGKGLREAAVRNLRETAEVLSRINLTGDAELERLRSQAEHDLSGLDAAELRKDDKARANAMAKADAILKDMAAVFGGAA